MHKSLPLLFLLLSFSLNAQRSYTAYTIDYFHNGIGLCSFPITQPESLKIVIPTNWDIRASCVYNNIWYGIKNIFINTPPRIVIIDTTSGNISETVSLNISAWEFAKGVDYDPITGNVFLATGRVDSPVSKLYTINLESGDCKLIGIISDSFAIAGLACSKGGQLYGIDVAQNAFIKIDKKSGVGTMVSLIGFDINGSQSLTFDKVTGVLYWTTYIYTNHFLAQLRTIDIESGSSTLIRSFPGEHFLQSLIINTDAGSLIPFNINYPLPNETISAIENSSELFPFLWDTSRAKATYNFVFGYQLLIKRSLR